MTTSDNFSEKALGEICKIEKELNISFIDATVEFCDQRDIDILDFLDRIDSSVEERIRESALAEGKVQKKYRKNLPLEF